VTAVRAGGLRRVEHCMGTVFSLDVRDPDLDPAAVDEAIGWLHRVDAIFSTYRPDSDISRLRRGHITLADCAPEVSTVLERCAQLYEVTDGYFDVHATGRLDPSGYVKGWAIQQAHRLLQEAGSTSHTINGGGDVQCLGAAAADTPWRIGITNPHVPGEIVAVVSGIDFAIATSGVGQRGAHIINPHTGRPPTDLVSLTVVGPRLIGADVYATAGFAMGAAAERWFENQAGYKAFAVTAGGGTWSTF
jgi:thiamine biosynthesis lipoprotein